MSADTYRGWSISWDYGRFAATGPNYEASWEGEEDGYVASGGQVEARTREDLIEEIDAWIEEHPEDTADREAFPQPQRRDGKEPCGECRLPAGEVCDICGAVAAV